MNFEILLMEFMKKFANVKMENEKLVKKRKDAAEKYINACNLANVTKKDKTICEIMKGGNHQHIPNLEYDVNTIALVDTMIEKYKKMKRINKQLITEIESINRQINALGVSGVESTPESYFEKLKKWIDDNKNAVTSVAVVGILMFLLVALATYYYKIWKMDEEESDNNSWQLMDFANSPVQVFMNGDPNWGDDSQNNNIIGGGMLDDLLKNTELFSLTTQLGIDLANRSGVESPIPLPVLQQMIALITNTLIDFFNNKEFSEWMKNSKDSINTLVMATGYGDKDTVKIISTYIEGVTRNTGFGKNENNVRMSWLGYLVPTSVRKELGDDFDFKGMQTDLRIVEDEDQAKENVERKIPQIIVNERSDNFTEIVNYIMKQSYVFDDVVEKDETPYQIFKKKLQQSEKTDMVEYTNNPNGIPNTKYIYVQEKNVNNSAVPHTFGYYNSAIINGNNVRIYKKDNKKISDLFNKRNANGKQII